MRTSLVALVAPVLAVLAAAACSSSPKPPAGNATAGNPRAEPLLVATTGGAGVSPPRCEEPPPAPPAATDADRERAIDAFLADRANDAVEILSKVVRQNPRDRAAEAFRVASMAKREEARTRATAEASSLRQVPLQPIPLVRVAHARPATGAGPSSVQLEKVSEKKNLIVDDADWEKKNGIARTHFRGDNLPSTIPGTLDGLQLRDVFTHADHTTAIYVGIDLRTRRPRATVFASGGKATLAFSADQAINAAPRPFEVGFAQVVGSTLLLELAYNGYANESGNRNGYFAAYDIKTGALRWASDPLVSNAREAWVAGGSLITGYGFTAEPDFLFVLDLATGAPLQKIPVKSGPSAIRFKDDQLFVRTYDTDYVFKSKTGFPKTPPADLGAAAAVASAAADAQTRCWVRRATAAIQARDAASLEEIERALRPTSRDRVLAELLQIEARKAKRTGHLDLQGAPLVALPAPPWQATPPKPPAPAPKLVRLSGTPASPTRDMDPPFAPQKPFSIAPVKRGALPAGARPDIPTSYGLEDLREIIPDQKRGPDRLILVYGGRYVALVNHDSVERVFDFDAFLHPPKVVPTQEEFAIEDVTYAQELDGTLYVCNGGGSYAKEVFGKKGFVSAIEAATGKLLWRSAPLVCNATFLVAGDHLVTGYGFTAEPDFVFLLRRSDGSIAQRVPVESGPSTIELLNGNIRVEMYGHSADFGLK